MFWNDGGDRVIEIKFLSISPEAATQRPVSCNISDCELETLGPLGAAALRWTNYNCSF